MSTFLILSVEIHLLTSLYLIPVAAIGHVLGLKMHDHILKNDQLFKRMLGGVLIVISGLGLLQTFKFI